MLSFVSLSINRKLPFNLSIDVSSQGRKVGAVGGSVSIFSGVTITAIVSVDLVE